VTLWMTDLIEAKTSPQTLSVYLSAVKKAVETGQLQGDTNDPNALNQSSHIKDLLKGHARTFTAPAVPTKSISAPFTLEDFGRLVSAFRTSLNDRRPSYNDTLTLAVMALALGGGLRPGEYLKTNALQRTDAILSVHQLSFLTAHPSRAPSWLTWSDFRALQTPSVQSISVYIKCGKTDQTKRGSSIPIIDPLCVSLILDYLKVRPYKDLVGQPFEPLFIDKSSAVPQQCVAVNFTTQMRKFLRRNGVYNPETFTLKSLRSGAVESIAQGKGFAIASEIASKGRWTNFRTPAKYYLNRPCTPFRQQ
jgi:hypothetical protein